MIQNPIVRIQRISYLRPEVRYRVMCVVCLHYPLLVTYNLREEFRALSF
jgi:hypothetical protein